MKKIVIILLLISSFAAEAQQNYILKNKILFKDLEQNYKKELIQNPNSAIPHWKFANELAKLTFRASSFASRYYMKALAVDSTNIDIYIDFGNYLTSMGEFKTADFAFQKGLQYDPYNENLLKGIKTMELAIRNDQTYRELHKMPTFQELSVKNEAPANNLKKSKSVHRLLRKENLSFKGLEHKFNNNPEKMSPKEMYYLLLGTMEQAAYNPENIEDEHEMQNLTQEAKINDAISLGEHIIKKEVANLIVLRELLYCYRVSLEFEKVKETETRIFRIFQGIQYSGDGTCEKPYLILNNQEEFLFCSYLGLHPLRVIDKTTYCTSQKTDKMSVRNKEGDEDSVYFYRSLAFENMAMAEK